MAAKSAKAAKSSRSKKSESFLANRPYMTIVVLAALVMALAYTVELIQNAQMKEAQTDFTTKVIQQQIQKLSHPSPTVKSVKGVSK